MIGAVNPKKEQSHERTVRSTHPAYTEYSWDSLASRQMAARPNVQRMNPPAAGYANCAGTQHLNSQRPNGQRTAAQHTAARPIGMGANARTMNPGGAPTAGRASASAHTGARAQSVPRTAPKTAAKAAEKKNIRKKTVTMFHTIVAEKKYTFPLSVVLIAVTFTVMIMAIITTSVEINEISSVTAAMQREYAGLVSTENELRLRLETRDDLRTVEEMAKNELGMVKKDQVERYYLSVRKEDHVELVVEEQEEKAGLLDGILSFGGSVVERVRAFFGL